MHRIRIDNVSGHDYQEADRQRYFAQLEFERLYGERVQEFYGRMLQLYRIHAVLSKGENYILDTGHDRVFAIARYDRKENFIVIVNEGWETVYTEIDLSALWPEFGVEASRQQFYLVKNIESGKEEVFSGEELMAQPFAIRLAGYEPANYFNTKDEDKRQQSPD